MKRRYGFGGAFSMACLLMALPVGCGGSSSSSPTTVETFCKQLSEAECTVHCTTATPEPCRTNRKAACMARAAAATADGSRMFVSANMADCISRSKAAYSSTAPITPKTLADIDRACNYVFQGNKKLLMEMCTNQYQCAGKTDGSIICDKGVCAKASTAIAVGSPCGGNPGDTCATGSYCATNSAGLTVCTARVPSGGACDDTKPCVEALRCSNKVCVEKVAQNGTCTSDTDCTTAAPYCNPYASSVCDTGLSFASGSTSCDAFTSGMSTGGGGAGGTSGGAGGAAGAAGRGGAAGGGSGGSGGAAGAAGRGGAAGGGSGGSGGAAGAAGGGSGGAAGAAGAGGAAAGAGGAGGAAAGAGGAGGASAGAGGDNSGGAGGAAGAAGDNSGGAGGA